MNIPTEHNPCPHCQISGPAILPVRYAVVPAGVSATIPVWATPATPFPEGEGYSYLLRALRQGFVYVYYEATRQWDGWAVAEDGSLWKQYSGVSAQPQKKSDCTMPCHNATNLEMLVLNTAALRGTCWIAYSSAKWYFDTMDRYARDAGARQKRMQCVEFAQWTTPANEQRVVQASVEALNAVADYMSPAPAGPVQVLPYNPPVQRISRTEGVAPWFHFDEALIRAQGTQVPWSRRRCEQAERTIAAMQKQGVGVNRYDRPITQLVVALDDSVGIVHELAGFSDDLAALHAGWLDELSIEFMTDQSLLGTQNQLEKQSEALTEWIKTQSVRSAPLVEAMTQTWTHDSPTEFSDQYQQATIRNAQLSGEEIAREWGRYAAELNHEKRAAFRQCYDQFCGVIASRMEALHNLRIAWLKSDSFITCSQDFYSTRVEDNLSYREVVDYALASLNLTEAGSQWLDSLINQYSAKSESNLVWRSLLLNNPDVIADMSSYLESLAKSHGKTEKVDEASFLAAVAPLAGKINEAYASANELLERPATPSSSFSRMMLYCDRRLSTFGDRFFSTTRLGKVMDTANELLTKSMFQVMSGVTFDNAVKLSVYQIHYGNVFRQQILESLNSSGMAERRATLNKYKTQFNEFSASAEGESALRGMRIKLLALIFNGWEFKNLLKESKGDVNSRAQIASALLGTLCTASEIVKPAVKHGIQHGTGTMSVKFIGASAGSVAAMINLVLDAEEFYVEFSSDHRRWIFVGLNGGKVAVDAGAAFKASTGLIQLLVERKLFGIGGLTRLSSRLGALAAGRIVSFLASWEAMIGLFLIEQLIIYYRGNDLQKWCREGVFGLEPDNKLKSTWLLGPKKSRDKEYNEQQEAYQKALGAVL